jgi:hypothetical protein
MKRYLFFTAILGMAVFGLMLAGCAIDSGGVGGTSEPGLLTVRNLPTGGWTINVYGSSEKIGGAAATAALDDNRTGRSPFKLSTAQNLVFTATGEYYVEIIVVGTMGGTKGADRVNFTNGSAVVDWNEMTLLNGNNNNNGGNNNGNNNNGGNNNGNNAGNNDNNNNNAGNNNGNNNNNGGNNGNNNPNGNFQFAGTWDNNGQQLIIDNGDNWTLITGTGENIAQGRFSVTGAGVLQITMTHFWNDVWVESLSVGSIQYVFQDNDHITFTNVDFDDHPGLFMGAWTRL